MASVARYCCCLVCKDTLTLTASGIDASACTTCYSGFGGWKYENITIDIDGDHTITHQAPATPGSYTNNSVGQIDYHRNISCGGTTSYSKSLAISVAIVCPTTFDPNPTYLGQILEVSIQGGNEAVFLYDNYSAATTRLFLGDTIPNQIDNCAAVSGTIDTSLSDGTGSVVIQ